MLTLREIHALFAKYNVRPTKRFGQNFLIDTSIVSNIVASAAIDNQDVVEIGPGLGSLTRALIDHAHSVTAYELDEDMIRVLRGEIFASNFTLVAQDFLQSSFPWSTRRTIVANIPYNITSDILFHIFQNNKHFDKAVIMVQKEVANRLLAQPGDTDYSKLTVTANHFGSITKVLNVKPTAFIPSPKVESTVVAITLNEISWDSAKPFVDFIRDCFAQRRKTLFNNLRNIYGADQATRLLTAINKPLTVRPQEISHDEFWSMFITI